MSKGVKIFGFIFLFILIGGGVFMKTSNIYPIALGMHDDVMNEDNVAIGGYDAVAYFTQEAAVLGSAEFTSNHESVDWKFSSAENLAHFEANPSRYIPAYGGHCSFGACKGAAVYAEPTIWTVVDGRLFFFSKEDAKAEALLDFATVVEIGDNNWN